MINHKKYLGFDTSNYTTSSAVVTDDGAVNSKIVLSVKQGEKGLRQSNAVFQHTVNLPKVIDKIDASGLTAIGVSVRPRNVEGSYMPCFLVGEAAAVTASKTAAVPLYKTSHQVGHILAALYSCKHLELIEKPFIAFHLSGGTTEAILVTPGGDEIIKTQCIAKTLDLNAGQAVDRTGVMLGMKFPCGGELDSLSVKCDTKFNIRTSLKGLDCSLSGVENKVKAMIEKGCEKEDAAKFVMDYISKTVLDMTDRIIEEYGVMPVVFSGGVSGSEILRKTMKSKYSCYFPEKEYGCDNASGVAVFAKLKSELCKY